jgi:hypothetical protein
VQMMQLIRKPWSRPPRATSLVVPKTWVSIGGLR